MKQYMRVIPRDLFNESKLLKCFGRVCLLIHDRMTPVPMNCLEENEGAPFNIIQLPHSGELTISNVHIQINGKPFLFKTAYNSKRNYPLFVQDHHDCAEYLVFDEEGNFTEEFTLFCKSI